MQLEWPMNIFSTIKGGQQDISTCNIVDNSLCFSCEQWESIDHWETYPSEVSICGEALTLALVYHRPHTVLAAPAARQTHPGRAPTLWILGPAGQWQHDGWERKLEACNLAAAAAGMSTPCLNIHQSPVNNDKSHHSLSTAFQASDNPTILNGLFMYTRLSIHPASIIYYTLDFSFNIYVTNKCKLLVLSLSLWPCFLLESCTWIIVFNWYHYSVNH